MRLTVRDPLKRTWERGIYMGADSTNPEAVKRNRPSAYRRGSGAQECSIAMDRKAAVGLLAAGLGGPLLGAIGHALSPEHAQQAESWPHRR